MIGRDDPLGLPYWGPRPIYFQGRTVGFREGTDILYVIDEIDLMFFVAMAAGSEYIAVEDEQQQKNAWQLGNVGI